MKPISIEESKAIQLGILKYFHNFCEENGLKYSLAGGTLLGAVRHKGFIPWDDDIDVFMYRPIYEKFIRIFEDKSGLYKLHCLENDKQHGYPYAKIEDTRTLLVENVSASNIGISIDVFPLDDVCDTKEKSIDAVNKLQRFKTLYMAKLVRPNKNNSFFKIIAILFLKFVLCFRSLHSMAETVQNKCILLNDGKSKFIGNFALGYGVKEIIPNSVLDDYLKLPFEDSEFYVYSGYKIYLTSIYGDYMKLPPEDQRHSPHTINGMYWK